MSIPQVLCMHLLKLTLKIKKCSTAKHNSYLNNLFDTINGYIHEGFQHVGIIQIICIPHTHEQDVSWEARYHINYNSTWL